VTTTPTIERLSTPRALREDLAEDVRAGLTGERRTLPSKYFYDARGSELFERITELPEYYLTRAETGILETHALDLVAAVRPVELLELGSGSSRKTRLLLEAMHAGGTGDRYVAIDVSEDALREAADALRASYPWLTVRGYVGDFHADVGGLPPAHGPRLLAFLGSTIGNLDRDARAELFRDVAALLGPADAFLLGADLVKDPDELVAAYDDAAGVTAEFNRNILRVVARELDADVPVDAFTHVVRWNPDEERIESSLRAERPATLAFPTLDLTVDVEAGEEIHTEISCKFRREGLTAELQGAGLAVERWLTDDGGRFALVLARTIAGRPDGENSQ
jgi:L-histidine N-alpha-methyltransferase